ncbi:MAG: Gfo/Idh/MocA family oxidoreductase [Calditrichia bacterium]
MSDKKFNLAIVGSGRWGRNHVRTAHQCFGEALKAVVDLDEGRRKVIEDISADIPFTTDLDAVLADESINAIIIATPAETHYPLAKRALESGKHVLVEKPMALFSKEAADLTRIAEDRNLVLMVGHLLIYHAAIRKIKNMIDTGMLGKLQYIYSNRLNLGTVRKEENILWSFAPHDVSVLQYLIGDDPIRVDARGGMFLQPGIHDVTLTAMTYPNNIQAHIHVSWLHPFKEHRLVVIGDKNMVVFEDSRTENKLILYPKGIDWVNGEPIKRDEEFMPIDYGASMPLQLEQEAFRDCVLGKQVCETDGNHAVKVLEILELAQRGMEDSTEKEEDAESKPVEKPQFFVHETALVDNNCTIGEGTKIWHFSHVQNNVQIGKNCSFGQNVNVANNVRIGDNVKVQNNVSIYEGVELEDYVFCGPSMVFTNVLNPRCEFPQRGAAHYTKTLVKRGASIGANATIVCGITIGEAAFIGAGAVVTKDVPDHALVVGNPGRVIGWMTRDGKRVATQEEARRLPEVVEAN